MKNIFIIFLLLIGSYFLGFFTNSIFCKSTESCDKTTCDTAVIKQTPVAESTLPLGAFSISLNVKDLQASKTFYEHLGFTTSGGDIKNNYLIMKNQNALIGLFQGMFEKNILTFNPGWDESAKDLEEFDDVREIQQKLKAKGILLDVEAPDTTKGPAYIMLKDPDGNEILIDQHR